MCMKKYEIKNLENNTNKALIIIAKKAENREKKEKKG